MAKLNTYFIGQKHIRLSVVDSTNTFLADLLRSGNVEEGTIVSALFQQNGKGQRGAKWESEKGENLLLSLYLKPGFVPADRAFYINKMVGVALVNTLKTYLNKPVFIKWPNDIFIADKKIAGVLTENNIRAGHLTSSIIGIGLNINQKEFSDEASGATSVLMETSRLLNIDDVRETLCKELEVSYLKMRGALGALDKDYKKHLYLLNQWCGFRVGDKVVELYITGVDVSGLLLAKDRQGAIRSFNMKEIGFIK